MNFKGSAGDGDITGKETAWVGGIMKKKTRKREKIGYIKMVQVNDGGTRRSFVHR